MRSTHFETRPHHHTGMEEDTCSDTSMCASPFPHLGVGGTAAVCFVAFFFFCIREGAAQLHLSGRQSCSIRRRTAVYRMRFPLLPLAAASSSSIATFAVAFVPPPPHAAAAAGRGAASSTRRPETCLPVAADVDAADEERLLPPKDDTFGPLARLRDLKDVPNISAGADRYDRFGRPNGGIWRSIILGFLPATVRRRCSFSRRVLPADVIISPLVRWRGLILQRACVRLITRSMTGLCESRNASYQRSCHHRVFPPPMIGPRRETQQCYTTALQQTTFRLELATQLPERAALVSGRVDATTAKTQTATSVSAKSDQEYPQASPSLLFRETN